ncbi:MAG: ATP-binding protein [Polyangiales bacterium]
MIGNASKAPVRGQQVLRALRRISPDEVPGAAWTTDRDLRIVHGFGRMGVVGDGTRVDRDIARHRVAMHGQRQEFRSTFGGRTYQFLIEPLLDTKGFVRGTAGVAIEMAERSADDAELRQRVAFLENAQRAAHVGRWEWHVATDEVTWSDEMYRIYALAPGDLGSDFASVIHAGHPDDAARLHAAVRRAVQEGSAFSIHHRIVRPDGRVRILQTRGEVARDESGKVERVFGCCFDVTDVTESASELERANSLLRATLEATADGTLVVDSLGRIATYNERFVNMWGIPKALLDRGRDRKLLDFAIDQLIEPEAFVARVAHLYEEPELESFDVLRFKDGRVFERFSRPQKLGDEVVGRVWSFRDVTERELLLRRAVFLADAMRCLNSLDVDEAVEAVSHLLVPFLGEECAIDLFVDGRPRRFSSSKEGWTDPPKPDPSLMEGRSRTFEDGGSSHLQVPVLRRGNTIGAICCEARLGRKYGARDIELVEELATRINLATENAQLFKGARDALRAREEFIAVAAHEIRGPVTAMHLAVQLLRKGHLDSTSIAKAIEVIEREDRRLGRFVEELLDLGRSRTGGLHFVLEDVNLAEIVSSVAARHAVELARSGSTLSLVLDDRATGAWDRLRLEQVVTNLITNAIKFGERGPIEVEVAVHDTTARLLVRDHGIGIPKEAQARIFDAFERAVPHRRYGGLGLGLYIVRTIVEGLGGTVRLESEPGEGTTFEVELPRKRSP